MAFVILRNVVQTLSHPRIGYLLLACATLGYVYQGPPFRLGYWGFGEILCFFAFGPFGVPVFYFVQVRKKKSRSLPELDLF